MSETPTADDPATTWKAEIRALESHARDAFLAADLESLDRLWTDDYVVNSPLQKVVEKRLLLDLLRSGRIRHTAYDFEIEHMSRHGDVVVVMGRDRVVDPPAGVVSLRRYTNVWRIEAGRWRGIARHAHVVSRANP